MDYQAVMARLAELSGKLPVEGLAELPAPPAELRPVVLATVDGRPPEPPAWWAQQPSREAAVLLLIHPDELGDARIVLTVRHEGGHRHAGQVSFPGGALDDADDSVVAAALREAAEEIGLDAAAEDARVLTVLAPVDVRVSGFLVHPVLASAARPPRLTADPHEVAAILHAPLSAFLPGAPIEQVTGERDGVRLRYGAYRVEGHLVWGATAGILGRLGAFLSR